MYVLGRGAAGRSAGTDSRYGSSANNCPAYSAASSYTSAPGQCYCPINIDPANQHNRAAYSDNHQGGGTDDNASTSDANDADYTTDDSSSGHTGEHPAGKSADASANQRSVRSDSNGDAWRYSWQSEPGHHSRNSVRFESTFEYYTDGPGQHSAGKHRWAESDRSGSDSSVSNGNAEWWESAGRIKRLAGWEVRMGPEWGPFLFYGDYLLEIANFFSGRKYIAGINAKMKNEAYTETYARGTDRK